MSLHSIDKPLQGIPPYNSVVVAVVVVVASPPKVILTTNLAAGVCVCVDVRQCAKFDQFLPDALISNPNVPKILFA